MVSLTHAVDIPPLITVDSPNVDATDDIAPSFDLSNEPAVQRLLAVWNAPDHVHMSCADCHGTPGATEFLLVGIDPADIDRRGVFHHPQEDIDDLREGLQRLAEIYGIDHIERDRDQVFLMQPGPINPASGTGTPLPGEHYWQRDAAFMLEELPQAVPALTTRIDTIEQALEAREQLLATEDVRTFRARFVHHYIVRTRSMIRNAVKKPAR